METSSQKYGVKFWVMLIIMFIITALLIQSIGGITILFLHIKQMGAIGFLGITIIYSCVMLIRVYRWKILLDTVDSTVPFSLLAKVSWIAWAQNAVVPARLGEITRLYYLKTEKNVNYSKTTASLVLEKFFDLFGLLSIVIIATLLLLDQIAIMPDNYLIGLKLLMIFVVIALLSMFIAVFQGEVVEKFLNRIPFGIKFIPLFTSFRSSIIFVLNTPKTFINLLFLSTIQWLIESTTILLVAYLLHAPINIPILLFAAVIGYATYIFPITPGSLGTFELFIAQVLVMLLGIQFNFALQIPFMSHVLVIIYLAFTGILATFLLKR